MNSSPKTKNKTFTMRCDDVFLDNLSLLARDMGVSKSQAVEITINIYPGLVELYNKLDRMIKEAKNQLE